MSQPALWSSADVLIHKTKIVMATSVTGEAEISLFGVIEVW